MSVPPIVKGAALGGVPLKPKLQTYLIIEADNVSPEKNDLRVFVTSNRVTFKGNQGKILGVVAQPGRPTKIAIRLEVNRIRHASDVAFTSEDTGTGELTVTVTSGNIPSPPTPVPIVYFPDDTPAPVIASAPREGAEDLAGAARL